MCGFQKLASPGQGPGTKNTDNIGTNCEPNSDETLALGNYRTTGSTLNSHWTPVDGLYNPHYETITLHSDMEISPTIAWVYIYVVLQFTYILSCGTAHLLLYHIPTYS